MIRFQCQRWDWNSPPTVATIGPPLPGEVFVWDVPLAGAEPCLPALTALLSADEQARADRLRTKASRRQFIVGRALLRQILGSVLGESPNQLRLVAGKRGKPGLTSGNSVGDFDFSVTHTAGRVAIAIGRGVVVGVDVEALDANSDWQPVAAEFFSAREHRWLRELPDFARASAFLELWTCKEAWLKATGEGLTGELREIEVALNPAGQPRWVAIRGDEDRVGAWTAWSLPLPEGFVGTVVAGGANAAASGVTEGAAQAAV